MDALEIVGLTHRYGTLTALDGVTFKVPTGAVCGLVGPNGAGKTTLLNIAATLMVPTSGTVRVANMDVVRRRREVRRAIGYMPDFFGVYEDMKVWEYLDYFGAAYRLSTEERRDRIPGLLEIVHLSDKHDEEVDSLSRGMQQRLCLARALIHDPRVLLLDEPAAGLDPRARVELRDLIGGLHAQGITILISSHVLSDLADVCTHMVVIEQGHAVTAGLLEDLLRQASGRARIRVRVTSKPKRTRKALERAPGVVAVMGTGLDLTVDFEGDDRQAAALLRRLIDKGIDVAEFAPRRDLEAAFVAVTEGIVS